MDDRIIPIVAVAVVYNKNCSDSLTCRCLSKIENINVIIADNSTIQTENEQFAQDRQWKYIDMNGNKGLAKAYNKAIHAISDAKAIVCLFDDDSEVTRAYFDCLLETFQNKSSFDIFLPFVYDDNGLMSPSIIRGHTVNRVRDIEEINQENITGINNGMAIRKEVFKDYEYDEAYFLDYIDHAFLRDMKKNKHNIATMDVKLDHQTFFESGDDDIEKIINRFRIFKKDLKKFCGSTLTGRLCYYKEITRQKVFLFLTHNKKIKLLFI